MQTVTVETMRSQLMTLEQARERLAATEPVSAVRFNPGQDSLTFHVEPSWIDDHDGGTQAVLGSLVVNGDDYRLTPSSIVEATSLIGMSREYAERTPARLIEPHLDYWFTHTQNRDVQMLTRDGVVMGFSRGTVTPYSNLQLLDAILVGISRRYGDGEVLVDRKFRHELRRTQLRVVVAERRRAVRPDDNWSVGVQLQNSLSGEATTAIEAYAYRWICSNGATMTAVQSPTWHRRRNDNVFEWAQTAVDEILGGVESELVHLDELARTPLDGPVDDEQLAHLGVPRSLRRSVRGNLDASGDRTVYGLMQAITETANRGLSHDVTDRILRAGGHLAGGGRDMCDACHRPLH